jgi:hypothetical protein
MTGPETGSFQMAVDTVFPRHSTSRGLPTLMETRDGIMNDPLRFPGPNGPQGAIRLNAPPPARNSPEAWIPCTRLISIFGLVAMTTFWTGDP